MFHMIISIFPNNTYVSVCIIEMQRAYQVKCLSSSRFDVTRLERDTHHVATEYH